MTVTSVFEEVEHEKTALSKPRILELVAATRVFIALPHASGVRIALRPGNSAG